MSSPSIALPSIVDAYPERARAASSGLDHVFHRYAGRVGSSIRHRSGRYAEKSEQIIGRNSHFAGKTDVELKEHALNLRRSLRVHGLQRDIIIDGFALVREVSRRTTGMQHFRTQVTAGLVMLDGAIAEMGTGEGKTLAVTLPAALVALAGIPVHVITVNDYLVHRDATDMAPIYNFLGLTVGEIVSTATAPARQKAYRSDITYCANNEIVFDYLRDRLALGDRASAAHLQFESMYGNRSRLQRLFLEGLRFAIVDEADSVLVDETRTPLILSAPGSDVDRREVVEQALIIEQGLESGEDFSIDRLRFAVELTPVGQDRVCALAANLDGIWESTRLREQLVKQAIAARYVYLRDQHYVVREGKVLIVDQHTGRIMPGRTWSEGMHQFVEAKEDCELTPDPSTLARVSYQSFFRRYISLSGMTGTAREVAGELWSVYSLPVVTIEPRLPSRRAYLGATTLASLDEKWRSVVAAVATAHEKECPVLVGTSSVSTSEQVSALLTEAGLQHVVLNAKQDDQEAEIISHAGERGRITVATNMAGRGTDIRLGPGVVDLGGLHVILTEYHDAARIDRQLIGRCARQGDPGSHQVIASLEDPIFADTGYAPAVILASLLGACSPAIVRAMGPRVLRLAQRRVEREYSRMRQRLLKADDELNSRLAFAGRSE